ncbi:MAG: DUF3592 domain-containing protein [Acidobacteriota bacterium]
MSRIVCPWCGTGYVAFRSNCGQCGGPLVEPGLSPSEGPGGDPPMPPPPPRAISGRYAWRLMASDGWAIGAGIFTLLGGIFTFLGALLALAIPTAFVGVPFLVLGILFLALGVAGLSRRHRVAGRVVEVLRVGEPVLGRVATVERNPMVRVNRRHPWTIAYRFEVGGSHYEGRVATLNPPALRPGWPVRVLYLPASPRLNTLYPHP